MRNPVPPVLSQEQRVAARNKALASKAAWPRLRHDFMDANYWDELAKSRGLRLPQWATPITPSNIRKWYHRLNMDAQAYYDWAGSKDIGRFSELNPDWPLRALVGLLLEWDASRGITKPVTRKSRPQTPSPI